MRVRGQSMAEFAVAVAALGMLMLGCITIAGFQETQRRGIAAAREAAFQGIWNAQRIPVSSLREQLARSHFNDTGLANATGTARIVRPADIELAASMTLSPGQGASATTALLRPLRVAGGFLGSGFDIDDGGFQSGLVSARFPETARLPDPFRTLQLGFSQPYALLGDDWSASSSRHVARRAGGLVPTHLLTPLARIWQPLSAPLSLFEPSLRELCMGLIEPDRVPEDRLGPGPLQGAATCF